MRKSVNLLLVYSLKFSVTSCNIFLPKINAKMSATVLIMKLQIKFLSLTFFLCHGRQHQVFWLLSSSDIFCYASYLICKGYNKWLETAVSRRDSSLTIQLHNTQRTSEPIKQLLVATLVLTWIWISMSQKISYWFKAWTPTSTWVT